MLQQHKRLYVLITLSFGCRHCVVMKCTDVSKELQLQGIRLVQVDAEVTWWKRMCLL